MQFKQHFLALDRPRVMGILNVTPDSFSDGGQYNAIDAALRHCQTMLEQGADFIDVGGESTRPGADEVTEQQELERVVPVIEAIEQRFDTLISIDTSKPVVMQEAVKAGASLINDVRALQLPGALEAAAKAGVPVCLMHMQGQPQNMQYNPEYQDVVSQVGAFLAQRVAECERVGIPRQQILLDPGFGFGKTVKHNYQLLNQLERLSSLDLPLLVGLSRKSMLGKLLQVSAAETLTASVAAAVMAVNNGASIVRVHDVGPTMDALRVAWAGMHPQILTD